NALSNQPWATVSADRYKKAVSERNGSGEASYALSSPVFESSYRLISGSRFHFFDSKTFCKEDTQLISEGTDQPLVLNIGLQGDFQYCYEAIHKEKEWWKSHTLNILSSPRLASRSFFRKNKTTHQAAIVFSKDYLEELSLHLPEIFSPLLSKYERGQSSRLFNHARMCSPQILFLMEQIRNVDKADSLSSLFLESKMMEILYRIFHENRLTPDTSSNASDKEKMMEARDILYRSYRNPPTLKQLSLHVGTNEFKLKQGFKALFHTTVYDAVTEYRMQHACAYLLDTALPLGEISLLVGFEHQSSFTKAFCTYYGVTPSEFRKQKR
ncbi:MAG TPA: hypothetical protein DDZ96_11745, partial [Porphyromonadaceae bacterium]|nr:hypothetical protein [Porphyromonadaceae bacterium]